MNTVDDRWAPMLQAHGLHRKLGTRLAVEDASVQLTCGQWVALVGPNGAGKSTLLSLLAGLQRPDAGVVLLQGREMALWPARDRARTLAWLSQQGEAEGDLAAIDVVRLARLPHHGLFGQPGAEDEAAVAQAMQATESATFASHRLNTLSGGERQRVLLARALAVQAPLLLLDEPTTHLDAPHQRALHRSLAAHARAGHAAVAVLHDLNLALAADRVWVMHQGRLVADGAPGDSALQATLAQVFEHAVTIQAVPTANGHRWVAVPRA